MQGFFKKVANVLIYKEQQNDEMGFELLEDVKEGSKAEQDQNKTVTNDTQS